MLRSKGENFRSRTRSTNLSRVSTWPGKERRIEKEGRLSFNPQAILLEVRARVPLHRLFLKIFFWYWLTAWAVIAIVLLGSRLTGMRQISVPNMYSTVAPLVAAEAGKAYESGGPEAFARFSQRRDHDHERQLFLLDGSYKDVLSRPLPDDGLRVAQSAETGQLTVFRGRIAAYKFVSSSGHLYILMLFLKSDLLHKRVGRLLDGDFTPPKTAQVMFDQLILSDGTTVAIHSDSAFGIGAVANSRYLPKAERPGFRQKLKGAMAPLREPNKMQRLGEAVVTSLPYHPEYIDQGTVFDAALVAPVTVLAPVQPDAASPQASDYLHLHLVTPIDSSTSKAGTQIEAVVSQPYYQADHQLLYPAGTKISGTVQKASAAGWMKKNGSIVFAFRTVQTPDGTTGDIRSTVGGIEAERSEGLDIGKEGEVKATTSTFARILAPVSLIGPSKGLADTSTQKTAWSRAGEGRKGFGLLGAGAAQASVGTSIGFGYFGAAKRLSLHSEQTP
jgi:hypothetical protein